MKELKVNNEINDQLQPVKTDEVASSLEISKSKVKTQNLHVDGDLTVHGTITAEIGGSGDMTGVDLTGGTGIAIASETGTTSGDYSATINCNLEGTELVSTGESGGSKFLREDGDTTCSWQTLPTPSTAQYYYDIKTLGYYATATAIFLPLTGYILEQTTSTGRNEYMGYVAPYNGTLEKIVFRSEIAQDGNMRVVMNNSADGTELPGSILARKDVTVDIDDDTTLEVDMTSGLTVGTNAITKGHIINIALTTPSNSNDTNVTVVFKWDVTT